MDIAKALRIEDPSTRLGFLVFCNFQFLDSLTTIIGTHRGNIEGNPLARSLYSGFGEQGFLLMKVPLILLFMVLLSSERIPTKLAIPLLFFMSLFYLFVVIHNASLLV